MQLLFIIFPSTHTLYITLCLALLCWIRLFCLHLSWLARIFYASNVIDMGLLWCLPKRSFDMGCCFHVNASRKKFASDDKRYWRGRDSNREALPWWENALDRSTTTAHIFIFIFGGLSFECPNNHNILFSNHKNKNLGLTTRSYNNLETSLNRSYYYII